MAYSDTKHVAIIGCGTIGRQVALVYGQHNRRVTLYDKNEDVAQDALHWIESQLDQKANQPNHVKITRDLKDAAENAWMVTECIAEDIDAKKQLLNTLSSLCASNIIITTNSSSIRSSVLVEGITAASQRRILNAHYFPPAQGPFVELMSCGQTSPAVIESLTQELREIGRRPVVCRADSTGFIMNRIWAAVKREIMMVLADGAGSPTDIDAMLKQAMQAKYGPCELMDFVGLQTVCDIEEIYLKERTYLPSYALTFFRENYVKSGTGRLRPPSREEDEKQAGHSRLRDRLLGAWDLVECTSVSSSRPGSQQKDHPLGREIGREISGHLIYSEAGYVSAQLRIPGQAEFKSVDYWTATPEEHSQAARRYFAYSGQFYVDDDSEKPAVQHRFTHCIYPNMIGQLERRLVHLETDNGCDILRLTPEEPTITPEGRKIIPELTWRRLPVNNRCV